MPAKKQPPAKPAAKTAKSSKKSPEPKVDRTLSLDQLSSKVRELRGDLIRHLNQIRAGASGNVRRPGQIRRQIARHLTAVNQKRRAKTDDQPAPAAKAGKPAPKAKPAAKKGEKGE